MATKTNTAKNVLKACACSSFEFGEFDGGNEDAITYSTGCKEQTKRTFAMGHDAKLVGFLVWAELAGEEIALIDGGMMIHLNGAVNAAARISDALADKAQAQLDAARARIAKKAAREAAETARKSAKKAAAPAPVEAPEPTHRDATIKVGRWTYPATIEVATGEATYTPKFGGPRTMAEGKYSEVK